MSYAERNYRARSKEGKLFPEKRDELRSDVIAVLDGKKRPKDYDEILRRLIKFCGWSRDKLHGPRRCLANCLCVLVGAGLIQADEEPEGSWDAINKKYW